MRRLQLQSFVIASCVLGLAAAAAPAQGPRPGPGQKPGAGQKPGPQPGAARPGLPPGPTGAAAGAAARNEAAAMSAARFGHMPFAMMAQPGMPAQPAYGMGSMMGYGSGMPAMPGNPSGAQGMGYPEDMGLPVAGGQASPEERSLSRILAACGLPNEDGRLRWPAGLQAAGGPEGEDLRRQIEALCQEGAEQSRAGPANAQLADELGRSVKALRGLFVRERDERGSLPQTTYEDAERFLAKLGRAQKMLKGGLDVSPRELYTRPPGAAPAPQEKPEK